MAVLQINFDPVTLASVLRYVATASASGRLRVKAAAGDEAEVYLERGKVVFHDLPESGVAGMEHLLTWQRGILRFDEGVSPPRKALRLFLDNVLPPEEDSATMSPDVSTLGVHLRPSSVLVLEPNLNAQDPNPNLDSLSVQLLMSFDGSRNLRDVVSLVGLPLETVISASRLLLAKSIMQVVEGDTPSTSPASQAPSERPPSVRQQPAQQQPAQQQPAQRQPAPQRQAPQRPQQQSRPTRPPTQSPAQSSTSTPATQQPAASQADAGADNLADFARGLTKGTSTSSQVPSPAVNYINPNFLDEFSELAVEKLGPVASMLVEDVLADLNASPSTLTANHVEQLVDEVEANITRQDWQEEFRNGVDALRANYGIPR
ncbi:MAG: DUF4388 domain-containing protein [Deinococcota bacterium]